MPVKEAIILAGGLGTRLRSVVPDLPKCMAPVNGKPFISYVIDHFAKQGIETFICALGYKHEIISDYLSAHHTNLQFKYSIENSPLGTGGAIKLACKETTGDDVLVLNGDTIFNINLPLLTHFHTIKQSVCTLSLKSMINFDRYGVIVLDKEKRVHDFREKQFYEKGLINAGVYLLKISSFLKEGLPTSFSFEKDYLEKYFAQRPLFGLEQDEYFIDIGIPEDFERAQTELKNA